MSLFSRKTEDTLTMKNKLPHVIDAKRRGREKEHMLLSILHTEKFINFKNLQLLLSISDKSNTYKLLKKLTNKGYLVKHIVKLPSGNITLWGITQAALTDIDSPEYASPIAFEPSKINFTNLNHRLLTQRTRFFLHHLNWGSWQPADSYVFKEKFKSVTHRPDAVMTSPKGIDVALEIELTLKSPTRYRSIIKSHILALQKKQWSHVIYVVASDTAKKNLKKRFERMNYIAIGETRTPFSMYEKLFSIFTIDEMKDLKHN